MKVITAIKKYLHTDKEIFLECVSDGTLAIVLKEKDFYLEFGERIADCKVDHIDENESPDVVTIYLKS